MTRRTIRKATGAALVALCLALLPGATSAQRRKDRFEETTSVTVVEIPVQVIVDGAPVRGLTKENFEIVDGRKRHEIIAMDVVDLTLEAEDTEIAETASLSVAARRHFLLLFDLTFSEAASVNRARQAALDLVRTGLHPSDVVAVATYSASDDARLILSFTSDRQQAENAIASLGLWSPFERYEDPLRLLIADPDFALPEASGGGAAGPGGGFDAMYEQQLRDIEVLASQARRGEAQARVAALAASLGGLARMMDSAIGRKHVIYLSEGFDDSILLGAGLGSEAERRRAVELAEQAASGESFRIDSQERFGSSSTQTAMSRMLEEFKRADCTIQAVDISGVTAEVGSRAKSTGNQALFMMAHETGGEYFRNYNDFGDAMSEVLERTSVTYVLAFQPREMKLDGEFHKVKVNLTGVPGKARVLHRPGYYAPLPFGQQNALQRGLTTAGLVMGGTDGGTIDTAVLAPVFETDGDKAYVPVLVEIDGNSLMTDKRLKVIPTEIYGYAIGDDGKIYDFFSQMMGLDVAKVGPALERSGFKFWAAFDLPPGSYTGRILVRNSATGDTGVRSVPIEVPSRDEHSAVLLPPLFPEPKGKWLLGRESAENKRQASYPFVLHEEAFIPAARPVLTDLPAEVSLVGYNLVSGDFVVSATVRAFDGEVVSGGSLTVDPTVQSDGFQQRMVGVFDPSGISAGLYQLEVSITDSTTGQVQSSTIPIRVVDS